MATYNINDLTVQNGKLYAGGVEVGARDTVGGLPAWSLNQQRLSQLIGQAPDTSNWSGSMFDTMPTDQYAGLRGQLSQADDIGNYYRGQIDPVAEFANVGQNRDALYGAYMVGANSSAPKNRDTSNNVGSMFDLGQIANPYLNYSSGLFDRKSSIPDLSTQWSGEAYTPMNEFISPISLKSAQEAQAILKQFFPNVSQADMDKAAYQAMQGGQWDYSGYNQPAVADPGSPYYGHGPLPIVSTIAKKLGGVTPELAQFFDQNWQTYANNYGDQRHDAKAAAAAETRASMMEGITGVGGIIGGAFGLSSLLNGGLGAALGMGSELGSGAISAAEAAAGMGGVDAAGWGSGALDVLGSGAASSAGGNMGFLDSLSDWFSNSGNTLSDLFGGNGSGLPEALGEAGGYDFTSSEVLGDLPQLLGEAGGYGASESTSLIQSLINKATADPLGSAAKALKAITGSDSSTDWMKLLGTALSTGVGTYAANQQTGALEDMAKRYEGYGAPYRQKLSDLYANPDSFLQSNEVRKPVQQGTDMLMRSLSTQGNPFGSGNALQQGQSYASDQLFSRLGQEKDRLAGFGGLANYNAAAPTATSNAINSGANSWNAMGAGVNNIFNPPKTPAQQAAEWMKAMGG